MTKETTHSRDDVKLDDDLHEVPISTLASDTGWQNKALRNLALGVMLGIPATLGGSDTALFETHSTPYSLRVDKTGERLGEVNRPISLAEALRIASTNRARIDSAMREEVERDAEPTAVWEEA